MRFLVDFFFNPAFAIFFLFFVAFMGDLLSFNPKSLNKCYSVSTTTNAILHGNRTRNMPPEIPLISCMIKFLNIMVLLFVGN